MKRIACLIGSVKRDTLSPNAVLPGHRSRRGRAVSVTMGHVRAGARSMTVKYSQCFGKVMITDITYKTLIDILYL